MASAPQSATASWKRALINAFILLHLFIIVFWGMPQGHFRNRMVRPVEDYVIWTGLWHSWDMFSPDPLSLNFNVEAHITFQDGSTTIWEFPRMEKLGLWTRYQMERYRKWRERVRQDAYKAVWDDTARWIARQHNNPTNPPVRVTLIRHWSPIPGPIKGDYQPIPKDVDFKFNYRFLDYKVKDTDL